MSDVRLPGTSPAYDEAEKMVHAAIFDVAFDLVFKQVLTLVPWLGWPVVKQVFEFTSRKLLGLFYGAIEEFFAKLFIDIEVDNERKAYEAARDQLKTELKKPKEEQNLDAKRKEMEDRLRDLVRLVPR